MGTDMKIRGLDEMNRKLERMKKNAKELSGKHEVTANDLLTPAFLQKHCEFSSFEQLVRSSSLIEKNEPITKGKFEEIPDDAWDSWIENVTDFPDWKSMLNAAIGEYGSKKLFEGV